MMFSKNNGLVLFLFFAFVAPALSQSIFSIIPQPAEFSLKSGVFILTKETRILAAKTCTNEANLFVTHLNALSGHQYAVESMETWTPTDNYILFTASQKEQRYVDPASMKQISDRLMTQVNKKDESYSINIDERAIVVTAPYAVGVFYATMSLTQMLPPDRAMLPHAIPCSIIKDKAHFEHRGMLLDCCRHFMSVDFVKKYIDLLALYKMNVLHWHLTEDQGWRIQIDAYPKLTEVGAWRKEEDGSIYGGYYTKDQIRDIVAYATARHITIIPEIELPGHSVAAIAAYPWLSCTAEQIEVENEWGVFKDIYCAGSEETFVFMDKVLDEVCALFPGPYIHIGGDEAPKYRWEHCDKCQARIKNEGLKNEAELQTYFIERVAQILAKHNKSIIGWDEILEGGIPADAMIQSWRGMEGGVSAAKAKHGAIMSPTSHCYFDYGLQSIDMEKVYSFDPIPDSLKLAGFEYIKGGECNMWTEHAPQEVVDQRIFPRMPALAEVLWTYNESRQFSEFKTRIQKHYKRWDALGVNYGFETVPVDFVTKINSDQSITVKINRTPEDLKLNYTLDEKKPFVAWPDSVIAKAPTEFIVTATSTTGKTYPSSFRLNVHPHRGVGITPKLNYSPSKYYTGGGQQAVTDGILGSSDFRDGHWQAQQGVDFEIVLDLKNQTSISKVSTRFFHYANAWIFRPEFVSFEYSADGKNWTSIITIMTDVKAEQKGEFAVPYSYTLPNTIQARFIKMTAKSIGPCPTWHDAVGEPSWLFIDEVVVEE
jgi:hexosaminidase